MDNDSVVSVKAPTSSRILKFGLFFLLFFFFLFLFSSFTRLGFRLLFVFVIIRRWGASRDGQPAGTVVGK